MAIQLWKDREKKIMDPELFSRKAEDFAQQISGEASKTRNKGTQLRKFFDEIVRLDTLAKANNNWQTILAQVHMLIAKVAYAKGRDLVSDSFVRQMKEGIYQIEKPEDLHIFASYLEAFTGYYKMLKPRD